jgi:hypothetical protein
MSRLLVLLSQWEVCAVIVLIIIWAALLVASVVGLFIYFPVNPDGLKDFFASAAIACTAVTAVMGSLVTARAARKLEEKKSELAGIIEQKKADLAKDLATHTEKLRTDNAEQLAKYNQDLQKELQSLRVVSDRQMEMMKATTLSREIEAYQELFSAADQYYATLSRLEFEKVEAKDYKAADLGMAKARSKLPYLENATHRNLWEEIWTKASFIKGSTKALSRDEEKQLWQNNVVEFGKLLQTFGAIVEKKFPRP